MQQRGNGTIVSQWRDDGPGLFQWDGDFKAEASSQSVADLEHLNEGVRQSKLFKKHNPAFVVVSTLDPGLVRQAQSPLFASPSVSPSSSLRYRAKRS